MEIEAFEYYGFNPNRPQFINMIVGETTSWYLTGVKTCPRQLFPLFKYRAEKLLNIVDDRNITKKAEDLIA